MILILHLVCLLCIFEMHLLNYERISEGSENHLKRHGTERVKVLKNRELQIREIQNRELQGLPVLRLVLLCLIT